MKKIAFYTGELKFLFERQYVGQAQTVLYI